MPISYTIDAERNLVLTVASGTLSDDEVMTHKWALHDDPGVGPGMKELSDVRGVERLEVTEVGVRAMAKIDRAVTAGVGEHMLAIVATEDIIFGMARMYEMLTAEDALSVQVFRDIDEATRWLLEPS
jgi:hypothetical protein